MDKEVPESLSVYRGQAREGRGEGPDHRIAHGEQYLWVEPQLYRSELLDAIRPWMTLDSDPTDHQRLNDQLEGWSFFSHGDCLFVVRLVSAGVYDRRAAYFSHGRVWTLDGRLPGFDPGLHLGRWDAFDQPWRDVFPGKQVAEEVPSLVRPEQVKAESQTAAALLGHLFQALIGGYPLVLAAPIGEFVSGGALHALVCFARGGLPANLRHACRIRVYSRLPELFLRQLGANFVVVPEDAAGTALTARPNATLLDRQGRKVAGKELDERALAYASAVVERAVGIPDGLPFFSERFHRRFGRHDLPSLEDVRAIQITYNLAFALAGGEERRADFLRKYLPRAVPKLGAGLDWGRLVASEEWRAFPPEALLDRLLCDARGLSDAEREFLLAVEDAASRLGLRIDPRLADWWDPDDPAKQGRLIELLAHDPPLVSDSAAAERTAEVPLARLLATGLLHGVLGAEARSGQLVRRAHESTDLAQAARAAATFEVLSRAVSEGRLDAGWARAYVRAAAPEELVDAARRWFRDPHFWQAWENVPKLLLDRLRALEPAPAALSSLVVHAGFELDPVDNLEVYLRLADLVARIDHDSGQEQENPLVAGFWKALPRVTDTKTREYIVGIAFDEGWRCLRPLSLVKAGQPRLPWAEEIADFWLEHDEIAEALDTSALLKLAPGFHAEASYGRLYEQIDRRMQRGPEATTDDLVRGGWWFFWRQRSRLAEEAPEIARRSALAWLAADAWTDGSGLEATLEAWKQVLKDLPPQVSGSEMARLRGATGRRRWPWIPPFEEEQLAALIDHAEDLGALAELAEALRADDASPTVGMTVHEYILPRSRFAGSLPPAALAWLLEIRHGGQQLPVLNLDHSAILYRYAGHRADKALAARISSVTNRLEQMPPEALEAAGNPYLWNHGRFLSAVAEWMNRWGSLGQIGPANARRIDENIDGVPESPVRSPSRKLVEDLVKAGLNRAAWLLQPEFQHAAQQEALADEEIEALLAGRHQDPCWQRLADQVNQLQVVDGAPREQHPLARLAERIRTPGLSREQRRRLASHGWPTFERAAHANPALMKSPPQQIPGLPHFDLAASLLGPGALGNAILQVVFAPANRGWREDAKWWRRLLNAMRNFRWHPGAVSVEDRQEVALALVYEYLDALSSPEQQALFRALRQEAKDHPEWTLPSEFGVRRQ